MSYATEQTDIESRFATNFTACAVKYENVEFIPAPHISFAELKVIDFSSRISEISGGNNALHRNTGIILINIHIPQGIGTKTGRALADKAAAVFRRTTFSGITCSSAVVKNAGESQEWYVVRVICPYYRDKVY